MSERQTVRPNGEPEWAYFAEALAWYPPNDGLTGAQVYGVVQQVRAALRDGRITPGDLGVPLRCGCGETSEQ